MKKTNITEERDKKVLRAVVELTREAKDDDVFYNAVSISMKASSGKDGKFVYPHLLHGYLKPYVKSGIIKQVRIPSETGNKKYIGYRADMGHEDLRRELR